MHRVLSSLGIIVSGIALSAVIFITLRNLESRNAEASFNGIAQERLDAVETNVRLTVNNLVSLGALHDASPAVEREQFRQFAAPLLARNPAIQALEWIPRVPRRLRQRYEDEARRDGFPAFQFTERVSPVEMARAGERAVYFPVFYVAPFQGNEKALGFDLYSDRVRREALQSSVDSGQMVATNRIKLVQETSDQYGFLVFPPDLPRRHRARWDRETAGGADGLRSRRLSDSGYRGKGWSDQFRIRPQPGHLRS